MSKKKKIHPAITRFPSPYSSSNKTDEEKIAFIRDRFHEILDCLGLDLEHESLQQTPERVAKMYVEEIFSGLSEKNFPDLSFFSEEIHKTAHSHVISMKVSFTSYCEHHLLPMIGYAYISYCPNKKIMGLSKFPRVVRYFAARPQLQERLTAQIADSLSLLLDTEDIAVSIRARHLCVMARGIEDESAYAITHVL